MANNQDLNPNGSRGGTSPLYAYGTSANTRSAISQKARILTPHHGNVSSMQQMGVMGTFGTTQSKSVEPVRGIGFGDKIAEIVPSVSDPVTLNFERTLLYLCDLWQATGYASGVDGPVRALSHHKWPFDVEDQLVFSSLADWDTNPNPAAPQDAYGRVSQSFGPLLNSTQPIIDGVSYPAEGAHSAIITFYETCWFTQRGRSYSKDSGIILESGDATCTDVHDSTSSYGEYLMSGNDPTIGQLGSKRFQDPHVS